MTADVVVRLLTGQSPVFHVVNFPVPPLSTLPLFLILGVVAALLGVVFNRALLASLRLFERTARWPFGLPAALVGVAVGAHRLVRARDAGGRRPHGAGHPGR